MTVFPGVRIPIIKIRRPTAVHRNIEIVSMYLFYLLLTHWCRVTYKCVSKLTTIGSDNGLSPGRRQAIIWTNAGILFIWPLGINFSEVSIEIHLFSFTKMHLKMSSGKWRPFVSASMLLIIINICCLSFPGWRRTKRHCGNIAGTYWRITSQRKPYKDWKRRPLKEFIDI